MCVLYTYVVGYRPTVINFYASFIIRLSAKKVNENRFSKNNSTAIVSWVESPGSYGGSVFSPKCSIAAQIRPSPLQFRLTL
jgi:hypothetical protein